MGSPIVKSNWNVVIFYIVFVPTKDRDRHTLPHERFKALLTELENRFRANLIDLTEIEFSRGKGITQMFGVEDTVVMMSIAACEEQVKADSFFQDTGMWIKQSFEQKEVFILRTIGADIKLLRIYEEQ